MSDINWSGVSNQFNVVVDTNYGHTFAFQDEDGEVFIVDTGAEIKEFTVINRRPSAYETAISEPVNHDGCEKQQGEFDYINWDVVPAHCNTLVDCNLGRVYAVQHTNGMCIDGLTGVELKEYRILARRPGTQHETDDIDLSATTSHDILTEAGEIQVSRGITYDTPNGERSMGKTVAMFNIHTGFNLTEEQGWQFMELLKMVRSGQGEFKLDNYVDGCSYTSLAGESAARDRGNK